jgi:hypothetical protein
MERPAFGGMGSHRIDDILPYRTSGIIIAQEIWEKGMREAISLDSQ